MRLTAKLTLFLFFLMLFSSFVEARKRTQYFNQIEFEIDFTITHPIITGNFIDSSAKELLIMGENENNQKIAALFVFDLASNNYRLHSKKNIPQNVIAFDLFTTPKGIENVLLLDSKGLSRLSFENNNIVPLLQISSLYLVDKPQFIARKKLAKDLNGDGLDDFIISDFADVSILLQQPDGEFHKITLPIKPVTDMGSSQIAFSETRIFDVDTNFDQKPDIVVIEDGYMKIYEQSEAGNFSTISNRIILPHDVSALPWWSIKGADGESVDQSNLEHRMVESIEDINGDDIVDVMIRQTKSSGVFDRQNLYEIHYGSNQDGRLVFSQQPDTLISAEGTLSGLELLDINGDGRKEILVSSFDIGISQIIGALLSGSIDQDVYVFSLDSEDKFNKKPLFSEEVDLNFSLSSGSTGQPVILSMDLNGDGFNEIMLSAGKKRLAIYNGENSSKLFKSSYKRHKLILPQDGSMMFAADLNNDERQEIIVRYGKQDDEKLRNKVVILSAK